VSSLGAEQTSARVLEPCWPPERTVRAAMNVKERQLCGQLLVARSLWAPETAPRQTLGKHWPNLAARPNPRPWLSGSLRGGDNNGPPARRPHGLLSFAGLARGLAGGAALSWAACGLPRRSTVAQWCGNASV